MRKHFLAATIAAVALIPSLAMAQQTCEQRSNNRVAGTVVGAGLGAIIGSAVAGHGDRNTGAVVGAIGGGLAGNQLAKGNRDCQHAYGYYDNDGRWHSNNVAQSNAIGYYDRNGNWVDGRPNGYYDSRGTWVANSATAYGSNASYQSRAHTMDVGMRISRINDRIYQGQADGSLSRAEARRATYTLNEIRTQANRRARDGRLDRRDQDLLQARLDRLSAQIRMDRNHY